MLKNSSISTGVSVLFSTGIVPCSGKPRLERPLVISTYFSPRADRGRTISVESTGNGLTSTFSSSVSLAATDPSRLGSA